MPDRYAYLKMGERDLENAMPWDKIDAAPYTPWKMTQHFEKAIANSKARIAANPQFKLIEENAKWIDSKSNDNTYSLNIDTFKSEQNKVEETAKKYKPIYDYKSQLKFSSLPHELEEYQKDPTLKEKRERWHESLSKDIYVEEALNVLDDLQPKNLVKTIPAKTLKNKLAKS